MEKTLERPAAHTEKLHFDDRGVVAKLCGSHNENLKTVGKQLGILVQARGNDILIEGKKPLLHRARKLLQDLYYVVESGYRLEHIDVVHSLKMIEDNASVRLREVFLDTVVVSSKRRTITPKSIAQKKYVDAMRHFAVVISIGPAGTGKTYLAMAMAIAAFREHRVNRIILTRPAVEAGEKLGFLPGDMFEKVNPYLRPLYDALHDILDIDSTADMIHKGLIEVAPLAFMRGRTLNDSFVILDEAQNTTPEQMKMFLTRLGFNSQAVITGDITQIDLPAGTVSGLIQAHGILADIPGIGMTSFTEKDVVRHPIVEEIIKAYNTFAPQEPLS